MRKRLGVAVAAVCAAGAAILIAPAVFGHTVTGIPTNAIVSSHGNFNPSGSNDDSSNGVRVYLSSPRHADSGSRGECTNPGHEENINGRAFGYRAANGNYLGSSYSTTSHLRNLHARGYSVRLSPNTRDNGYAANRTDSQNWGSDIHLVTHSNASGGCQSSTNYFLVMYEHASDNAVSDKILEFTGSSVPGSDNTWKETALYELETNASFGDAYVELQFHDNQARQGWMYNGAHVAAWGYGAGVDSRLGYP